MRLREKDLRAVLTLSNELSEFGPGRVDEARTHCLASLSRLIGASNAYWVGAVRSASDAPPDDGLNGWRVKAFEHLESEPRLQRLLQAASAHLEADPLSRHLAQSAGACRAFRREEIVDDATWKRSSLYNETVRTRGIEHRLVGAHPLDARVESYIGLDRARHERPFSERERDLLAFFMCGSRAFHHAQAFPYALPEPLLSPRERQVLGLLLTDRGERAIAAALGLTPRTTHQYVVSILKKFGVSGRVGLMALALGTAECSTRPVDERGHPRR